MDQPLFFAHCVLAILLFFITNWIGKHSIHVGYVDLSIFDKTDEAPAFNFLYRAFAPVAFIVIISAVSYGVGHEWVVKNIYLVVIYYFAFRVSFNLATGKRLLINWFTQGAYFLVSVPTSYFVYNKLIIHQKYLFPNGDELGSAMWIAIVVYIYHTFNNVRFSKDRSRNRKDKYLSNRYYFYKREYGPIISQTAENKRQEMIIYAVLIYEAFNRPKLYRWIENVSFFFGVANTLGIMQVKTDKYINDEESVLLGAKKIVKDHQQIASEVESCGDPSFNPWVLGRKVITRYNKDDNYVVDVHRLYSQLVDKFAPEVHDDWEAELAAYRHDKLSKARK